MVESLKIEVALEGASDIDRQLEIIRNGFASLGRVAVPVFAAITVAIVASTKATIAFAESINKVSQAAIGVGQSFENFVKLRTELEKFVPSSKNATSGIENFTRSLEKIKAAEIAADLDATKQKLEGLGITVKQFPRDPFQAFREAAQQAAAELPAFIQQLSQMPDSAERSAMAIERLGSAAGTSLIQSLKLADPSLSQTERSAILLTQAFDRLTTAWENFGSLTFAPAITQGINTATEALEAFQAVVTNFSWQTLSDGAEAAFNLITGFISAFTLQGMITWIEQAILKWIGLGEAAAAARKAMQAPGAKLPEPGGIPQMARGGLLGGRGTGTSDSNLAWLSRGEHIMPASVVRQPGVLSFLESLRRGGNIPGYAGGGVVGGGAGPEVISGWITSIAAANNTTVRAIQATQIELQRVIGSLDSIWQQLPDKLVPVLREMTAVVNALEGLVARPAADYWAVVAPAHRTAISRGFRAANTSPRRGRLVSRACWPSSRRCGVQAATWAACLTAWAGSRSADGAAACRLRRGRSCRREQRHHSVPWSARDRRLARLGRCGRSVASGGGTGAGSLRWPQAEPV